MKLLVLVFFLPITLSFIAFGQSAKKWNKLLLAQYTLEQQKQGAAKALFIKTRCQFDSVQLASNEKIKSLRTAERKVLEHFMKTSELTYKLKELGVEPFPAIIADFRNRTFTGSQEFTESIKRTLKTYVVFDDGSDSLSLRGQRRKAQNRLLSKQITKYQNRSSSNSAQQQELESSRDKLRAFLPRMDSMLRVYNLLSDELVTDNAQLKEKMNELEVKYRKRGPKGFSDAYQKVFPGVFLSAQKELFINSELKDPEESIDPYPVAIEEVVEIYEWTEEPSVFPGGVEKMKAFIAENLHKPEIVEELNISDRAYVRFVISENGEISNVEVIRGVAGCKECDEEAIRLVKSMPDWIPGRNNGKVVKSYRSLPIKFGI